MLAVVQTKWFSKRGFAHLIVSRFFSDMQVFLRSFLHITPYFRVWMCLFAWTHCAFLPGCCVHVNNLSSLISCFGSFHLLPSIFHHFCIWRLWGILTSCQLPPFWYKVSRVGCRIGGCFYKRYLVIQEQLMVLFLCKGDELKICPNTVLSPPASTKSSRKTVWPRSVNLFVRAMLFRRIPSLGNNGSWIAGISISITCESWISFLVKSWSQFMAFLYLLLCTAVFRPVLRIYVGARWLLNLKSEKIRFSVVLQDIRVQKRYVAVCMPLRLLWYSVIVCETCCCPTVQESTWSSAEGALGCRPWIVSSSICPAYSSTRRVCWLHVPRRTPSSFCACNHRHGDRAWTKRERKPTASCIFSQLASK